MSGGSEFSVASISAHYERGLVTSKPSGDRAGVTRRGRPVPLPLPYPGSSLLETSLASCPDGRAVELITIAGAGHQWPGSPDRPLIQKALGLDTPSTALNATDVVWAFFAAHP